jgi:predicted AAA+ superfamily ATPase
MYTRAQLGVLTARLAEPRRFLQVLVGPRQVGKTTLARQALQQVGRPAVYASADGPAPPEPGWIDAHWDAATLAGRDHPDGAVLVLDEVQKVRGWSEVVKARWDDDAFHGRLLRVVLLGSGPLLVSTGLSESLAGRFELIRVPHWSWPEMRDAFGWDLDRYVLFGGYPGTASLVGDPERWRAYVRDSLVETTLSRDVLLLSRIEKPALLRQLFDLACAYSGRELSFNKMLGQLQDAGNTTILAHYLELLSGAGLVTGLRKHAGEVVRQRGSSPKLLALDTALITSAAGLPPDELRADPEAWGRLVESCVGAHLVNTGPDVKIEYWRDRDDEVDFVLSRGPRIATVEVKTTPAAGSSRAQAAFERHFGPARHLLVGPGGLPLDAFLSRPASFYLT